MERCELRPLLPLRLSSSKRTLRLEDYFLSWTDSSPNGRFLADPLSEVALSTIIRDIQVVLTSLQQHLQHGPFFPETNLWSFFAHTRQFRESQQIRPRLIERGADYNTPLDLSIRREGNTEGFSWNAFFVFTFQFFPFTLVCGWVCLSSNQFGLEVLLRFSPFCPF